MKIEDVSLRIIQIESNLQPAPDSHHLSLSHNLEAHATVQWFQTSFLPHSNCHNSWAKFPPYLSISGLLPVFFHNFPIENIWKWLENPAPGHIFQPFSYIFPKFPNLLPWPFPSHNGSAIVTEAPRGCRGLHAACRGSPTASDPPGGPRHTRHVRSRPQLATDHWDTRINLGFVLFDVGFGYYGGCTKKTTTGWWLTYPSEKY